MTTWTKETAGAYDRKATLSERMEEAKMFATHRQLGLFEYARKNATKGQLVHAYNWLMHTKPDHAALVKAELDLRK